MSTLIIIEHDNRNISQSTLKALSAATAINQPITALVMGEGITNIAQQAAELMAISHVVCIDDAIFKLPLAENFAPAIAELAADYSHIFAAGSAWGKNVLPRLAALLDVMLIADINAVIDEQTFVRNSYSGSVVNTIKSLDKQKVITVKPTKFQATGALGDMAEITNITGDFKEATSVRLENLQLNTKAISLADAKIVVAGGRGFVSSENFNHLLSPLAKHLGAAVGGSREAVDGEFCSNDCQIGQTGQAICPDLYLAVGISGAMQHVAGIKDAKLIAAINDDPNAAIFNYADYGLVMDLNTAIPELTQCLLEMDNKVSP